MDRIYESAVTTTCKLRLRLEIMVRLQHMPVYAAMFWASYFNDHELLFLVHDYRVFFNMKSFFLITGLRFMDYLGLTSCFAQFRQRVFPFVLPSRLMRMTNVMHVFNALLHQLDDADDVKYMFCGKYPRQPVTEEYLVLVLNLDEFSSAVLDIGTYGVDWFEISLTKSCIFPNSSIVGSPISGVIRRAVAYNMMSRLHVVDCECLFDDRN
uniref:Uncharacterized protein n=1 Tax=Lactuca sativa TaxID=4236 RepID=A0A9R1US87_LACSA|nr:hypothetical protein LSAT_V11C800414440 [Lactuca sativa]